MPTKPISPYAEPTPGAANPPGNAPARSGPWASSETGRATVKHHWRATPPWARWGAVGIVVVGGAVAAFLLLFQWNWLRGPLESQISGRLHRPVAITGDLEGHVWSWSPSLTVKGLVISNPAWAGAAPMATLPKVTVSVHLPDLLKGQVILPLVEADAPDVRLRRLADGRTNWTFSDHPQPLKLPAIRHFVIQDGHLRMDDQQRKLVFVGTVTSNEQAVGTGRGVFMLTGQGTLNGAPFNAHVTGGPLLNIDPNRPYPFSAQVEAAETRVSMVGIVPHPFDLSRFTSQLKVSGDDLSDLYRLTGLALPATPPYALSGGFARVNDNYAFQRFQGRVGDSDLGGDASIDVRSGRPMLTADLVSRRLSLADLGAVIGAAPRDTRNHTLSPAQIAAAKRLSVEHRILPDARLDLARVRGMDAKVSYRAQTVQAKSLPIRQVSFKVDLDHGVLKVDPLAFTLPQGQITGMIRIDARGATPTEAIDLRLTGARLEQLVAAGAANPPITGGILARAQLSGSGDSVRSAAGGANGVITVVIPHGQIRQSLAELLGINATKGLFLLLANSNDQTPVRCAVADFHAQNGILTANRIVLDTGVVLALGKGQVNLKDETVDLRLEGKPKKFRLIRIAAPITLRGRLEAPKAGVDLSKAAGQLAIAGAVGAFVSPLAVILPFVNPGLAKDADCSSLLTEAAQQGAPVTKAVAARAAVARATK